MISRQPFGRTNHDSSRLIFGGWALSEATQVEADRVLEILLENGVNHIDTARMYRKSEERIGPWMDVHRDKFFVASKTRSRTYKGAMKDLRRTLELLHVDHLDLWQMHALTSPPGWEQAMGPGGTLEAFEEARENGMVRHLGVTGHGIKAPMMHIRSLERFDFDSVLLPYNYPLMQKAQYAADFESLTRLCRQRGVVVQTIKSVARQRWGDRPKTHNTYFYEPLVDQEAIEVAVHWAMGLPNSFVISAGDMQVLPKVLDAAVRFDAQPPDSEITRVVAETASEPIFT
jgi:aryl-alcohol dehydrogenase-like predicted oxidoreductase